MGIDRDEMKEQNNKINSELNDKKPQATEAEVKETSKNKDTISKSIELTGNGLVICGAIGTATLIITYLSGIIGLSTMLTIIIMIIVGAFLKYLGGSISTGNWNPLTA